MNQNNIGMTPESLSSYNKWHWILGLILAALLFLLPMFTSIGPNSWRACATPAAAAAVAPAATAAAVAPAAPVATPAPVVAAAPAVAVPAPVAEAPKPAMVAEAPKAAAAAVGDLPAARVYFALDRYRVPRDTRNTLAKVVAYLKANPNAKAVVTGFHDPQGKVTKAYNEALAQNRARAVRGALGVYGIPASRVVLERPQETTGTGSNDEARRVEVIVRP
jgi:outer membrane protein OmpA-like peptidoglycan-associated protein